MYRSLLVVLMGFLVCSPGFAAETEESVVEMGEVVVTATRQAEELSTVPANVTVVTEEEIARSAALTVPELLRSVAGVSVSDVAGNARNYSVDLRGFGETGAFNTLVLIDGRRINQMDGSGVDWALVPIDRVARIEIVRGGRGSVLYGDNAAGGVINIITKKGTKDLVTTGKLSVGSYGTLQADTSVSGEVDDLSVTVSGSYRTSDGYRDNSDTLARDAGLNLEYAVSEKIFLSMAGGYHEDETRLPGYLKKSSLDAGVSRTSTIFPDDYANTKDWYLRGKGQYYISGDSYVELDVSTRNREYESASVLIGYASDLETELETMTISPQLVLNEKIFGYDLSLQLGIDYEKNDMDTVFVDTYGASRHELSKKNAGYFAHADIALSEKFSLSSGLRNDRVKYHYKSILGGSSGSSTADESLYTAGVNYRFAGNSSVYASYSKSFRYPHLDELYSRYSDTVNDDLNPQTSDDFELGARFQAKSGLIVGLNLFHVTTEDEIYLKLATYGNENLDGDTVRKGVELSVSKELYNVLLSGSYTYTKADIDGGEYDGKEWPFAPRHRATFGAQTELVKGLLLGLNGSYVGKRRLISDVDNDHEQLDDYFYLTSKLTYLLTKGSLYVAVNNVLNEEYAEYGVEGFSGATALYPSPKINFVVGADFRF